MKISVSNYTSVGKREKNEDAVKVIKNKNGVLALLADGLGGMNNGELASELALNEFLSGIDLNNFSESELIQAVIKANTAVRTLQKSSDQKMCTTLAALWLVNDKALSCYVGDSRIYQIRSDKIKFQSVDHSVSQIAVLMGEISADEIRGHRDRNKLIRSIGADDTVKPQIDMLSVKEDDAFLLCSDGFWEQIIEQDIVRLRGTYLRPSEWLSDMRSFIEDKVDDNNSAIAIIVN